jgi:type I restriction enzyme S subunit
MSVISLPAVTFAAAGTTTKTSIIHLRNTCRTERNRAFLAVCNDVGFTVETRGAYRTRVSVGQGDLPNLLIEYATPAAQPLLGKWIKNVQGDRRWDAAYHTGLSEDAKQRLQATCDGDLRLSNVASLSLDKIDPRTKRSSHFKYVEISDVDGTSLDVTYKVVRTDAAPGRARKHIRSGDVLVSTVRPERRTVGVVPEELDGEICTTGFAVLRPTAVNPFILARLLQTDFVVAQLTRNNSGVSYPVIDEECLLDVLLPIQASNLQELEELALQLQESRDRSRQLRRQFYAMIDDLVLHWEGHETRQDPIHP